MTNNSRHPRVIIIGAGIAGLMIGYRFAEYGIKPIILEASRFLADGATTRNQGWLHAGGIHAQQITDLETASRVVTQCQYGRSAILKFCSECVEEFGLPSIALTRNKNSVDEIENKWKNANVFFKPIPYSDISNYVPSIQKASIEAAWFVDDTAIDTRILCTKLAKHIEHLGGEIVMQREITEISKNQVISRSLNSSTRIDEGELIIISSGYNSQNIVRNFFDKELAIRYWKSHLLITERIQGANFYCIDTGQASFIHHQNKSIIGRSHDNILCSKPSLDIIDGQDILMKNAAHQLSSCHQEIETAKMIACVKVDVIYRNTNSRNLDINIIDIDKYVICAFPGKMTEAPYLADNILKIYFSRMGHKVSALRPMDN